MLTRGHIMTLQQLKYMITVAEKGSITEAAKELYISQPSLSGTIKDVEKEVKITGSATNGTSRIKIYQCFTRKTTVLCVLTTLYFWGKCIC